MRIIHELFMKYFSPFGIFLLRLIIMNIIPNIVAAVTTELIVSDKIEI